MIGLRVLLQPRNYHFQVSHRYDGVGLESSGFCYDKNGCQKKFEAVQTIKR